MPHPVVARDVASNLGHEPHQYVTVYVEVEDLAASLAKAVSLGGEHVVGPIDTATGSFVWFKDPGGNLVGLWKPKK